MQGAKSSARSVAWGRPKHAFSIAARECGRRYISERLRPGTTIGSPADSREFLLGNLRDRPHEVFCCLFLDNRHRVLAFDELFRGTIDAAAVYPREIVKQALARNAAAVILAHNHPSGVAEPSQSDQLITRGFATHSTWWMCGCWIISS